MEVGGESSIIPREVDFPLEEEGEDTVSDNKERTFDKLQQAFSGPETDRDVDVDSPPVAVSEAQSTAETAVPQSDEYRPSESDNDDASEADQKEQLSHELSQGFRILREIMSDSNKSVNWAFMDPVNSSQEGLQDYYERVPYPMWLKKIYKKFEDREYETITQFVRDMRLMLENCYRFNGPDHYISKRGQKLETVLEQKLALLSRDLREKTSIAATSGQPIEEKQITGTRRRKILAPHDSSVLLAQLRAEEKEREKEARRLQMMERKQQQEAYEQELAGWEASLFPEGAQEQLVNSWELPQIGHFLYLCADVLNLGDVVHWELEHSFLLPRESATMELVMTSLLSTPYQRTRLDKKPSMPYHVWEEKLRTRIRQWYKILHEHGDCISKTSAKLGIDEKFFKVVGMKNPLDRRKYHELSFYQRIWIMKSLCDWCLEHQESIREAIEMQPIAEQNTYSLGTDGEGNIYMHFPQFCGADLRVYRQTPFVHPTIDKPKVEKKSRHRERGSSRRKKRKKEKKPVKPAVSVTSERSSRDSRLRQNPAKIVEASVDGSTASSTSESEEDVNTGDSGISGSDSDDDFNPQPSLRSSLSKKHLSRLLDDQSDTSREATPNRSLRRGRRGSPDVSRESTPSRTSRSSAMTGSRSSTPLDFSSLANFPRTTGRKTRNSEAAMSFEYFDSKLINGISDTEDNSLLALSPAPSPTKLTKASKRKRKSKGKKKKRTAKDECDGEDEEMCDGNGDDGSKNMDEGETDACDKKSPLSDCDKMEVDEIQSSLKADNELVKSESGTGERRLIGSDTATADKKDRLLLPEDSQSNGDEDDDEEVGVDSAELPFKVCDSSPVVRRDVEMTFDECDSKPSVPVIASTSAESSQRICSNNDNMGSIKSKASDINSQTTCSVSPNGPVTGPSQFEIPASGCADVKLEPASESDHDVQMHTSSLESESGVGLISEIKSEPFEHPESSASPMETAITSIKTENELETGPSSNPSASCVPGISSKYMTEKDGGSLSKTEFPALGEVKVEPVEDDTAKNIAVKLEPEEKPALTGNTVVGEVKMETADASLSSPTAGDGVKMESGETAEGVATCEKTEVPAPVPSVEEEPEPEPEIKGPVIGEFVLLASTVEELRALTAKFAPESDGAKDDGSHSSRPKTSSGKRKRCEQELYDRLVYLLKELEPWEQKLILAHKKARLKMRKEQENYKEPEIKEVEDVWESEESASEASSDDDDSDDSSDIEGGQDVAGGDGNVQKLKSRKKTAAVVGEDVPSEAGDEELEVSSRGRILKKRIIPNNIEDSGVPTKKRRPDQDKDLTPSPTPNILQSGKSRSVVNGPAVTNALPGTQGLSVLNINNQTLLVTPGQNPVILQTSQANLSAKNMALLAQLAGTKQKLLSSGQTVTTMPGHGQQAQQVIKSLLAARQGDKSSAKAVSLASSVSSSEPLQKQMFVATGATGATVQQQLQAQLSRKQVNVVAQPASKSVNVGTSSPQKQASAPAQTVCFSYNNLGQLPPSVLQQILKSQGLQLRVKSGLAGGGPGGAVPLTTGSATPTALTNLIQAGLLPAGSATQPSMLRIVPNPNLPKNPQTVVLPTTSQVGIETQKVVPVPIVSSTPATPDTSEPMDTHAATPTENVATLGNTAADSLLPSDAGSVTVPPEKQPAQGTSSQLSALGQANPGLLKAISSPPKPKYAGNVTVKSLLEDRALRQRGSEPIVGIVSESPAIGQVAGGHKVILNPGAANIQLVCKQEPAALSPPPTSVQPGSSQLSNLFESTETNVPPLSLGLSAAESGSTLPTSDSLDDVVKAVLTDIPTTLPTAQIKVNSPFAMPSVQPHRPITMTTPSAKKSILSETDQSLVQGCVMSPNVASQPTSSAASVAEGVMTSAGLPVTQLSQPQTLLQVGAANKTGVAHIPGVPNQPAVALLQGGSGMQGLVLPPGLVLSPQILNAAASGQQIVMQNVLVQTPAGMQLMQVPMASAKVPAPTVQPTQLLVDASGKLVAGNILPTASVAAAGNLLSTAAVPPLVTQAAVAGTAPHPSVTNLLPSSISPSQMIRPPGAVISKQVEGSVKDVSVSQQGRQAIVTSTLLPPGGMPSMSTLPISQMLPKQQVVQKLIPSVPQPIAQPQPLLSTQPLSSSLQLQPQGASSQSAFVSTPIGTTSIAAQPAAAPQMTVPSPVLSQAVQSQSLSHSHAPAPATQPQSLSGRMPGSATPVVSHQIPPGHVLSHNVSHLQSGPPKQTIQQVPAQPVVSGHPPHLLATSTSLQVVNTGVSPESRIATSTLLSPIKLPPASGSTAALPIKAAASGTPPDSLQQTGLSSPPSSVGGGKVMMSSVASSEIKPTSPSPGGTKPVVLHVTSNDGKKIQVNVAMPHGMTLQQLLQSPQLQQRLASIQNKGVAGPPAAAATFPQQAARLASPSKPSETVLSTTQPAPLPSPQQPIRQNPLTQVQPEPVRSQHPLLQQSLTSTAAALQQVAQVEPKLQPQVHSGNPVQSSLRPSEPTKPSTFFPAQVVEQKQERLSTPVAHSEVSNDETDNVSAKEMAVQALQLLSAAGPLPAKTNTQAESVATNVTAALKSKPLTTPLSPSKVVLYNVNGQLVTGQGVPVVVSGGMVHPAPHAVANAQLAKKIALLQKAASANKTVLTKPVSSVASASSPAPQTITSLTSSVSSHPVQHTLSHPNHSSQSNTRPVMPVTLPHVAVQNQPVSAPATQIFSVPSQNVSASQTANFMQVPHTLRNIEAVPQSTSVTQVLSPDPNILIGTPKLLQSGTNPATAKTMVLPAAQPVAGLPVLNPRIPGSVSPRQMAVLRDASGRLQLPPGVQAVKLPDNRIVLQMASPAGSGAILSASPAAPILTANQAAMVHSQPAQSQLISLQAGQVQQNMSGSTSSTNS